MAMVSPAGLGGFVRVPFLLLLALPLAAQDAAPVDLRAFYMQNCVRCHGVDGTARDAAGAKLKGQDFTEPRWRQDTPDKDLVKTILKGKFFGLAMPAYKDKLTKEQAQAMVTDVLRKTEKGKPVGTPDAGAYWRVISEYKVKTLFTAPTGFRAIKREDPNGELQRNYDLSNFRYLFLAGERLDPETYQWASDLLEVPVIDHWWQTETGWPIAANHMGLEPMPVKPGSPTVPVPGFDVRIFDETGQEVAGGTEGLIMIKLPLPPGVMSRVWGDDAKFTDTYLSHTEGYYLTGDGGHYDEEGYLFVMGRVDDVINVAGHRLSTGEIEEIIAGHPDVAECAVIGVADPLKGQVPRGLAVLKAGVDRDHAEISAELVQRVRDQLGAVASLRQVDIVNALPKTRSGKVLRKNMRAIADGVEVPVPSTIDNPAILDALRTVLHPD